MPTRRRRPIRCRRLIRCRRPIRFRRLSAAGLAACVAVACFVAASVVVAGCDSGGAPKAPPQPRSGGTLVVNVASGLDLLDPQRTYSATEMNVLRLTNRTLTTYRSVPGQAAGEIVGDLATDTGRPSEHNTVWRFTLKPGLRWENGEPVVCGQLKYGIERRFSTLMDEGAAYPKAYLKDNPTPYEGPWVSNNNGGKGLEAISCTDERNVVFRLRHPVADFGYTVALSTFAPVPPEKDTKLDYAKHPYSNGPYKLQGSLTADGLTLVRNTFWSGGNDQVRKAYPDAIVFHVRRDSSDAATRELIDDQGDARNAVMLDGNVAPGLVARVVNDPNLNGRTVTGSTGVVRFMAINTRVVGELACRQALVYAFNKRTWREANGGEATGDYATTIIPPGVKAYKSFDLYDSLSNPDGHPDRAIALMAERRAAGRPCDSTIKVAFPDTPLHRQVMTTVVEAYQRVGIRVDLVPLPAATYLTTGIGDPTNRYHMMLAGRIPDWASGSAILPALYGGTMIPALNPVTGKAAGNANASMLNDPTINQQIEAALAETRPEQQFALWSELDQRIGQLAVSIPILYEESIRLTGSNVLGGFIHPVFGMLDLRALGLAQP